MTDWSTVNKDRHYWKYRVRVDYWEGNMNYVNRYFDSLDEAKGYQERMLTREYVNSATLSEEKSNDQ